MQREAAQHAGFGLADTKRLDQIADVQKRALWPIAVTVSTRAAERAGRIEARTAPITVRVMASP